ncbi:MAG: hypothetical protein ACRDDY_03505 [Clostridium sp.]|uniref:hypothetical protein n=1 Tax=Clostridium sp. TaxID=1506 RepID=UPI003EE63638
MERFLTKKCAESTKIKALDTLKWIEKISKKGIDDNVHFFPHIKCSGCGLGGINERVLKYLHESVDTKEFSKYLIEQGGRELEIEFVVYANRKTVRIVDIVQSKINDIHHKWAKQNKNLIDKYNHLHVSTVVNILNAMGYEDMDSMMSNWNFIPEWSTSTQSPECIRNLILDFASWNGDLLRANGYN